MRVESLVAVRSFLAVAGGRIDRLLNLETAAETAMKCSMYENDRLHAEIRMLRLLD
jgi:hypothetical protein